jgi:hypothetical protein
MNQLTTIKMEIQYIKEKLEKMPTRDEMALANKELVEGVLESCDKRYAPKWTERAIAYVATIVIAWVIYYVLNGI